MSSARFTDEEMKRLAEAVYKGDVGQPTAALLLAEARRARESEAALVGLAKQLTHVPVRDCPWGCDTSVEHYPACPVSKARALLAATGESR